MMCPLRFPCLNGTSYWKQIVMSTTTFFQVYEEVKIIWIQVFKMMASFCEKKKLCVLENVVNGWWSVPGTNFVQETGLEVVLRRPILKRQPELSIAYSKTSSGMTLTHLEKVVESGPIWWIFYLHVSFKHSLQIFSH